METLFRSFRTQLEHTSTEVVRFLHDQIAWDSRLVAILGARGVGKTTLLLQHIKLYDREDESLYVTADDFYFIFVRSICARGDGCRTDIPRTITKRFIQRLYETV